MQAAVDEIRDGIFRLNTYVPEFDLGFSQFLLTGEEPVLVHTGMRGLFPVVRDAVARVIDPASLRWITFSHFESDESGSVAEWREVAPDVQVACSLVAKLVNVDDAFGIDARPLGDGEVLEAGPHRLRWISTPQVPHCWEAGVLFEEGTGTLFCSDLLHQNGDAPATVADADRALEGVRKALEGLDESPLAGYLPWRREYRETLERLAALEPTILATMHGSVLDGDGGAGLRGLASVMTDALGEV